MVSILKKSLGSLAGFGNPDLLPPADCISTQKYSENDDEDDCTGCSNPCSDHKEYPSYLNIEQDMPILGSVKPYGRHILIATGVSDWPRKIQHEKNTFAHSLSSAEKQHRTHSWKNLVTNSSLISTYTTVPDGCDVLIYPDNIIISNVTSDKASEFYNVFLNAPLPTEPADIESMSKDSRLGDMKIHKSPYKTTLLLCSHKKRDKRCGVTAPILAQEFDHVLREKDLTEQDAAVIMVSHIGGKAKN